MTGPEVKRPDMGVSEDFSGNLHSGGAKMTGLREDQSMTTREEVNIMTTTTTGPTVSRPPNPPTTPAWVITDDRQTRVR